VVLFLTRAILYSKDKTSNSELGDGINSTHQWYRDAHLFYAYLIDFPQRMKIQSAFGIPRGIYVDLWRIASGLIEVEPFKSSLLASLVIELYAVDWI
jgi:hypothetical protein